MCRLVAYLGHDVLLEDVLVKPVNSIVMQSLRARESSIPTNGDGFGLGWYVPSINDEPALFTAVSPAWNDRNLLHLTAKIKSSLFFAHVRAASIGGVTQYNRSKYVCGILLTLDCVSLRRIFFGISLLKSLTFLGIPCFYWHLFFSGFALVLGDFRQNCMQFCPK